MYLKPMFSMPCNQDHECYPSAIKKEIEVVKKLSLFTHNHKHLSISEKGFGTFYFLIENRLPVIPATIIWIPTIISAIASNMPMNTAPTTGEANIAIDNPISITPATMRKILVPLPAPLCAKPCHTLAIPSNNKAIASRTNRNTPVPVGYAITISAIIMTKIPRPTLPQRDFPGVRSNMPLMTLSIPTISKTIPKMYTMVTNVIAGKARTYAESIRAIIPKPI
jgi:hypothetical protein